MLCIAVGGHRLYNARVYHTPVDRRQFRAISPLSVRKRCPAAAGSRPSTETAHNAG